MGQPRWWGWHQLDPRWAERLVADSAVGRGDLVIDVGAGTGALTAPLIDSGARVIAIELHPRRAEILRKRFGRLAVVVEVDAADLWLPRRAFHVVANPPFAVTTGLLTRLLGARSQMESAHLVLPDWAVQRWSRPDAPGAPRWRQHFNPRVGRAIPRHAFVPAAPRRASVLVLQRRQIRASGAGRPRAPTSAAGKRNTVPSRSGCSVLSAVTTMRSPRS